MKTSTLWKIVIALVVVGGACGLIMQWMAAKPLGPAEDADNQQLKKAPLPSHTGLAKRENAPQWYVAVGTVRPRTETRVEAEVTAKVIRVHVRPGDKVTRGKTLITLDDRQLTSRLDQAREALISAKALRQQAHQGLVAAEAAFAQAEANYNRTQTYFKSEAATAQDMERAEALFRQAGAEVKRAREARGGAEAGIRQAEEVVREARIAAGYARILAPETGVVLKRMTEPGDLALPGKPLLFLQTAGSHRLEAHVPEGLIAQVAPGKTFSVTMATLNRTLDTVVEEVVPYADPQSRTFLVKASLPTLAGLYPGMFGKLRIPIGQRPVVTVPEAAVRRVGQLTLIRTQVGDQWQDRYITIGQSDQGRIEILSGLQGGETIGWE